MDLSQNTNVSPLSYGQMVQENFIPSDYIDVKDINTNPESNSCI
jgi:hypothetical protein